MLPSSTLLQYGGFQGGAAWVSHPAAIQSHAAGGAVVEACDTGHAQTILADYELQLRDGPIIEWFLTRVGQDN